MIVDKTNLEMSKQNIFTTFPSRSSFPNHHIFPQVKIDLTIDVNVVENVNCGVGYYYINSHKFIVGGGSRRQCQLAGFVGNFQ